MPTSLEILSGILLAIPGLFSTVNCNFFHYKISLMIGFERLISGIRRASSAN